MRFEEVIGQEKAKQQLGRMVQANRMPHALMMQGPHGSGKLSLAHGLAQYVLCRDRKEGDSCGKCSDCVKTEKLIHPDLHFSFPVVGSKATSDDFMSQWRSAMLDLPYFGINDWLQRIGADNQQGNIGKDECVRIMRRFSLKTYEGSHKVLIMWLAEYLGKEGNRLLKLIEEPPQGSLFILISDEPEKVLNTIRSRCQLVNLQPLGDGEVIAGLKRHFSIGEEEAKRISRLADGDFCEAARLADQRENDNARLFLEWMRTCYKGNGVQLVKWVDAFSGLGRENQKHFLRYALHFLREFTYLSVGGSEPPRLGDKEAKTAQNMMKVMKFEQVEKIARMLDECYHYVERNANPKILFLDTSIRMHKILLDRRS
ncbi:MAG: DNA polymerase III subunit [Saprospiraceae bacterium]|nr:DNA polymerase III subunit [Saprospiraceae bacterium]